MKKYKIEIKGVTDLLVNKYSNTLNKEKSSIPKDKLPEWEENNWQRKAYTNENGELYIPDVHIVGALRNAAFASGLQLSKKSGRKTIGKKFIDGNLLLETNPFIENSNMEAFETNVKIGTNTIMIIRPKIAKGWTATFNIFDLNDSFTKEEIYKLFDYAGKFVGIGDWRPKFGRFLISSIKEVN